MSISRVTNSQVEQDLQQGPVPGTCFCPKEGDWLGGLQEGAPSWRSLQLSLLQGGEGQRQSADLLFWEALPSFEKRCSGSG